MKNDFCLCGHRQWAHLDTLCAICKEMWLQPNIVFHHYRADNLKFLEDEYKETIR